MCACVCERLCVCMLLLSLQGCLSLSTVCFAGEGKTAGDHIEQLWTVRLHGAASSPHSRDATRLKFLTEEVLDCLLSLVGQTMSRKEKGVKMLASNKPLYCWSHSTGENVVQKGQTSAIPRMATERNQHYQIQFWIDPLVLSAAVGW